MANDVITFHTLLHVDHALPVTYKLRVKARVNRNLSEILGSLKRDKKGKKWLWNTIRQLPAPQ